MTWLAGGTYVLVMAVVAGRSYQPSVYEFEPLGLFVGVGLAGVVTIAVWRGRDLKPRHWLLPLVLGGLALASRPSTSRDFYRYLFDGALIRLRHLSPYAQPPSDLPPDQYSRNFQDTWWVGTPSPYGPVWHALTTGINWASHNQLTAGIVLLKLVNAAALLVAARYVHLIAGRGWLTFSFLINPILLVNTAHTPHPDMVIAAPLLAAYHHLHVVPRSTLLAAAALIKPPALLLLPFLARRPGRALALAGALAAAVAVLLAVLGPLFGYDIPAMVRANLAGSGSIIPSLLLHNLLPGLGHRTAILGSYGLFVLASGATWWAWNRGRLATPLAAALALLAVPVFLLGLVYPWHLIVPLAFLALTEAAIATEVTLLITFAAFSAPVNILTLVLLGLLVIATHWYLNRASPQPGFWLAWKNARPAITATPDNA